MIISADNGGTLISKHQAQTDPVQLSRARSRRRRTRRQEPIVFILDGSSVIRCTIVELNKKIELSKAFFYICFNSLFKPFLYWRATGLCLSSGSLKKIIHCKFLFFCIFYPKYK